MTAFDLARIDIGELVKDKFKYNQFVYTSLEEAQEQIKERRKDSELEKKVEEYLHGDVPEPLKDGVKAVLYRQVVSPNYEFRCFLDLIKDKKITPMFLEYPEDKFTSINPLKHSLAKMKFQVFHSDKHRQSRVESMNVVDFNSFDGKKFKEVETLWNQSFIHFHHDLVKEIYPNFEKYLFDASEWFLRGGANAKKYYSAYLALFVRHGILFENFLPEGGELSFVKEVFLPAFIDLWLTLGVKPLIVNLLPFERQNDGFWLSHPLETLELIHSKIKRKVV
jgi:hypothetical protein